MPGTFLDQSVDQITYSDFVNKVPSCTASLAHLTPHVHTPLVKARLSTGMPHSLLQAVKGSRREETTEQQGASVHLSTN